MLVLLLGFIIRIYHDARFSECQICPSSKCFWRTRRFGKRPYFRLQEKKHITWLMS